MPPHFFGLAQRNGSGAPKKSALVRVVGGSCLLGLFACRRWSSRHRMALYADDRALLRFARGTATQKPRGQGGGAPNKRRDKHPAPNHANHARGRAPPAPPISLARARKRGRRITVPFCHAKWDTLEKPCVVSGTQRRKHRNGRPHRAAKIAPGLCLGAIPYLAPLRRNRAAVRRAKCMALWGHKPQRAIHFLWRGAYEGDPRSPS